ncbi:uncharacterized protein [Physcomitrium patens]|uniref:uncharacterized protein isoform X3 n=1 Tax=Physcomitrium patens TaxID=3218 RepID=UPI000D17BE4B|nr:uncharacterized protein LOC112293720 isoform X3 [Physcomitrium patens]|eukprot:XP_024399261.1 uncharacterized protein LOC112293720 isoform X3 [Physcomitrella patens]
MPRDAYVVSRPEVVPCPGLWYLMQFQLLPSDFPNVRDDSFFQAFIDFVDKGLIDAALRSSYGTWYMERECDANEEEKNAVKLTTTRFKLVGGLPDLVARHTEKQALLAFLQYQKECLKFEGEKLAAEKELRLRRESYSTSESAAPVLRISAQSVLNEGCFLFANLLPHSGAQAEVFQDINFLLHGSTLEREMIVHKVQSFLRIVRQRAAGDMAQLHPKEFRVLWCGGGDSAVNDALKKFMLCLKSREDLNMRWVSSSLGHSECDSVAVMQAREAVLKAIHKLHDQRVISDKNRLLAASSRLQSIDVKASDDKFQALLEPCSQRKISDSSANGSSGQGLDDGSNGSSYSTSGSAETQQDSRPSHEVKEIGIDVERPLHTHDLVDKPPRKHFNTSPDLNVTLDSDDSYSPASPVMKSDSSLTLHMTGLHVVPPKSVSVLGVEVQTSDPCSRSPLPLHFHGPSSGAQSPKSHEDLRPAPLHPDVHADSSHVASPLVQTRLSENPYAAETSSSASASANHAPENYSPCVPLMFTAQSSFSTSTTATTRNDSLKES